MPLLSLFFLAHSAVLPPEPHPSPEVRITLVNATSVPNLSVSTTGTNQPVAYPLFPQATWTGNTPVKTTEIHYLVRNESGKTIMDRIVKFLPVSSQILLMTGDLSTEWPSEKPPQLGFPPQQGATPWPHNLQLHTYPCEPVTKEGCHYRVVNGMPSKTLVIRGADDGKRPGRQLALLAPGDSTLFIRQPADVAWEAEIDGLLYPLPIRQEGTARNCLLSFFLQGNRPVCIRVFEIE